MLIKQHHLNYSVSEPITVHVSLFSLKSVKFLKIHLEMGQVDL